MKTATKEQQRFMAELKLCDGRMGHQTAAEDFHPRTLQSLETAGIIEHSDDFSDVQGGWVLVGCNASRTSNRPVSESDDQA